MDFFFGLSPASVQSPDGYNRAGQETWTERVTQTTLADISLYSGPLGFLYHASDAFIDQSIGLLLYSASDGSEVGTLTYAQTGTVFDVPQLTTEDSAGNTYVASSQANRIAVIKYSGAGVLLWNTRIAAPGVLYVDEDAGGATVSVVANPGHAASFTLGATGGFTYKPVANYTGTDTFTYKAKNAYGTSNTGTVTITVK